MRPSPPGSPDLVRGLLWQHLEAAARPRLGEAAWEGVVREARGPAVGSLDPFDTCPAEPFRQALLAVASRLRPAAPLDGLADLGRASAAAWAAAYRSLVRRAARDPRRLLEVVAAEVHPWLRADPRPGRLVDAGPTSAVLDLGPGLPEAYEAGFLEGVLAAAGVPGARVAREGGRWAVGWERPPALRPPLLEVLARAVRLPFLTAALVPVVLGGALAWAHGLFAPLPLALTLLGVALLQLGAYAANDYFDHRSRADDRNVTPTPFSGGSRVIQQGLLRPRQVLALALGLFAAGGGIGVGLALWLQAAHGAGLVPVLALGVAGVLLGVLYTAPPVRLAHRGLGELAVGLGFGPLVMAGTYLVQSVASGAGAVVRPEVLLFSLPVGALVAAVLAINEVPDRPWDAQAGKRTLVVRLGAERAVALFAALLALAYLGIAAAALLTGAWPALLALLTLPLALRALRGLRAHHGQPYRLVPANATTLLLHLTTGLLLSGGVVLGRLLAGA